MDSDAPRPDEFVNQLIDRLAVVACIANDCAELVAIGDEIPGIIWRRLRFLILSSDDELEIWRELPFYKRARSQIRICLTR